MVSFSKMQKLLIGVGALGGIATIYYLNPETKNVHASWTNNYHPVEWAKWDENWDHRSPKFLVNPKYKIGGPNGDAKEENQLNEEIELYKPKAARHLLLIRHGQYHVAGESDKERQLTELGRLQADFTGNRLKELGIPYTKLIKSTMARADETGTIISKSLPELSVTSCPLLREGAPIPPEPPLGSWKQEMHFFVDGARIEAAFRKYFHRADPKQETDSYTILVCHANVIRYFVCRALQFPAEGWLRMSLNHASITWITINPSGRVILRCLGDSGHMPPEVVTSR